MTSEQVNMLFSILSAVSTIALLITTVIYTRYTGRMAKSDYNPKLYLYAEQLKANGEWDKRVMVDFCEGGEGNHIYGEGFVNSDDWYKWNLVVVNNGKMPATNIEISYTIKVYKNEFKPGVDKWYSGDYSAVVYKEVKKKLSINYLPPDNKKEILILYLATFPEAQLEVDFLKCNEDIFIKSNTIISRYRHPEFEFIASPNHARKLLGLIWE